MIAVIFNEIDDIPHFLLLFPTVKSFWKSSAKWWFSVTKSYILLGFVGTNNITEVLYYCLLYAKYYIYIQKLFNKKKNDVYAYPTLFKNTLKIECQISINNNNLEKFEICSLVYDQL